MTDLKINKSFVKKWSAAYLAEMSDRERLAESTLFDQVNRAVRSRGHYTRDGFLAVVRWKNLRGKRYAAWNDTEAVEEITRIAFETDTRFRLAILDLLDEVGVPVASALLTVWCMEDYTVLDWRAVGVLREAGVLPPGRGLPAYGDYLEKCRELSGRLGVSLRDLDRALWKYSQKELSPRRA